MANITVINEAGKPLHGVHVMTVTCRSLRQTRNTNKAGKVLLDDVLGRTEVYLRDHAGKPWMCVGNPLRSLKGESVVIY